MNKFIVCFFLTIILFACNKTDNAQSTSSDSYIGTGSISKGLATTSVSGLYSCTGGRVTSVGTITSIDGKSWVVPGENNFVSDVDTKFDKSSKK